eukprot:COSAG06_NODE_39488_length_412_cov_0.651757_1_plen_80_part_01
MRSEACACPRLTRACALLSPWQIHGGILSIRNSPDHEAQISELGIEKIDNWVAHMGMTDVETVRMHSYLRARRPRLYRRR